MALLAVRAMGLVHGCMLRQEADRLVVQKGGREIHLAPTQWPYLLDAVRRFDNCHSTVSPHYVGKNAVADFSRPRVQYLPWLGVELFCTSLAEEKADAEAYLALLEPEPGDVVLDIGAYCGATACAFSRVVGASGRVIAVEADPLNASALIRNVEALSLSNVTTVHAAIWSSSTTVRFVAEGAQGAAVAETGPRKGQTVEIPALTFEDLCSRLAVRKVAHVKLDIEGAEYEVLRGNRAFFTRHRPKVVMEVHPSLSPENGFTVCKAYFDDLGYRVRRVPGNLLYCQPV